MTERTEQKATSVDPSSVITVDMIVRTIKGLAAMIVAFGIIGAAWVTMGLPLPATMDHLDDRMKFVVSSQAEIVQKVDENKVELNGLIEFAKGTRSIVLRQDRRNIQEEIDRYREMSEEDGASSVHTKRLIETLQEDVDALERQIDELER